MTARCRSGDKAVGLCRGSPPNGWFGGINWTKQCTGPRTEHLTCTAVDCRRSHWYVSTVESGEREWGSGGEGGGGGGIPHVWRSRPPRLCLFTYPRVTGGRNPSQATTMACLRVVQLCSAVSSLLLHFLGLQNNPDNFLGPWADPPRPPLPPPPARPPPLASHGFCSFFPQDNYTFSFTTKRWSDSLFASRLVSTYCRELLHLLRTTTWSVWFSLYWSGEIQVAQWDVVGGRGCLQWFCYRCFSVNERPCNMQCLPHERISLDSVACSHTETDLPDKICYFTHSQ